MAVRFEQMQPLSPAIAGAYGASEALMRGTPLLQRQMESGNEQRARAAQLAAQQRAAAQARGGGGASAGLALAQRQTEADYQNIQRALIADGDTEQREADRDLARQNIESRITVSARDVFEANAERVRIQERAQAQAYVNNMDLSHKERLGMERMKAAIATVQNDREIPDEIKSDLIAQLVGKVSPLEQRAKKAQADQFQQRAEMMKAEAMQLQEAQQSVREFQAKAAQEGRGVLTRVGASGRTDVLVQDKDGKWYDPFEQAKAREQERLIQARQEVKPVVPFDPNKAKADAIAEAELRFPDDHVTQDDKGNYHHSASPEQIQKRNSYQVEVFERERNAHFAKQQQQQQQGGQQGGQPGVGAGAFAGPPQQQAPSTGERVTNPPAPRVEAKPFDRSKPDSMDPVQMGQVTAVETVRNVVLGRPDLDPQTRERASMMAEALMDLLAANGSYEKMPPPTQALYRKYESYLTSLEPPAPKAQPQPARPAGDNMRLLSRIK